MAMGIRRSLCTAALQIVCDKRYRPVCNMGAAPPPGVLEGQGASPQCLCRYIIDARGAENGSGTNADPHNVVTLP
ncbi:hypothetical protein [uncultured Sphingomonas sp.]|uniref:hypothetical protein n=1 Tax=uncultured Sphingomonas sp. TaxID=158754 RepID=UPI0026123C06|nr:hypothetical protein [uncultured Sphingomonas sp.]